VATSILTNASPNMTTIDFSQVVGTTAVTVFGNGALYGRNLNYMRIWNVSASATLWLSRSGAPAAVNGAGSYPLGPGLYEMFTNPQAIPLNPLSIISTLASTPVTIEVG
jgi:hypothetical protein